MKYLVIAVSMLFSSVVVANGPPEGTPPNPGGGGDATANATSNNLNSNLNSNSNKAYGGAGGTGIGVGVGKGGNASAEGGTAVSNSAAEGGDARSSQGQKQGQRQSNVGVNNQGQSQTGINEQGQSQGNIGVNKATGSGNKTDVNFEQNYESADAPAIAPSVFGSVSHSTCFANIGGSVGWVGAAIGINAWKEDYQCTVRANTTALKEANWSSKVIRAYQMKYVRGLSEVVEDMEDGQVTAANIEDTRDPVAHWDDANEVKRQSTAEVDTKRAGKFGPRSNIHNPYGL